MLLPSIFGEDLFDDWMMDFPFRGSRSTSLMKTDVKETENGYEVAVDLPGFKKDEISAQLKDGYLTISLERWRLFFQNVNQLEEVRKPDISWLLLGVQSETDCRLRRPEEIGRELNKFLKSMHCKKECIAEILGVGSRMIPRYIKGTTEIKLLQFWMLREVFQEEISLNQLLLEKIEH